MEFNQWRACIDLMENIQYILCEGWEITRGDYGKEGWEIFDKVIFSKNEQKEVISCLLDLECFLNKISKIDN